jgi:alpha-tubulin suppressor-like RCC1 family protein
VRALTAGTKHTCALLEDASVTCWGQGNDMQLGAPAERGILYPVRRTNGAAEVDAGGDTTCIRRSNGEVACWGNDFHGQASGRVVSGAGVSDLVQPQTVAGISAAQIAIDDGHSYARLYDGSVWSWGVQDDGKSPHGPAPVAGITGATHIVAGWGGAVCAYLADNVPWCWGSTMIRDRERADYKGNPDANPERVPWLADTRLAFGGGNHCLWRTDGELACWGYNHHGGAGTGDHGAFWMPRRVHLRVTEVALGDDFGCAVATDDTLTCWGNNEFGQLGNGTRIQSDTPVRVALQATQR